MIGFHLFGSFRAKILDARRVRELYRIFFLPNSAVVRIFTEFPSIVISFFEMDLLRLTGFYLVFSIRVVLNAFYRVLPSFFSPII